ncbi:MAG: hypothetical protein JNL01_09420 [Bdellovibrionales bacterium]|nr:hypothetical protein [Bdellovibrionales bacterium]
MGLEKPKPKPQLDLITQPQEYFRELLTAAMSQKRVSTSPETEFYLVNLLNQFLLSDRLRSEPLAFLLKEAVESPQSETQKDIYQYVGDVSLYVAGFFPDSLNRKLVDVDYYIEMGGNAYRNAASLCTLNPVRDTFEELSDNFSRFVEVLAFASDRTATKRETDLLRMYELWLRTKSERAANALQEAGIIPNASIKKDIQ